MVCSGVLFTNTKYQPCHFRHHKYQPCHFRHHTSQLQWHCRHLLRIWLLYSCSVQRWGCSHTSWGFKTGVWDIRRKWCRTSDICCAEMCRWWDVEDTDRVIIADTDTEDICQRMCIILFNILKSLQHLLMTSTYIHIYLFFFCKYFAELFHKDIPLLTIQERFVWLLLDTFCSHYTKVQNFVRNVNICS